MINFCPIDSYRIVKIFTESECQFICKLYKNEDLSKGETHCGSNSHRKSSISWIKFNPKVNGWIFKKLNKAFAYANYFFQYDIDGFDRFQLTVYNENDYYDWHTDGLINDHMGYRKLSCAMPINDDFTGGKFEIFKDGKETIDLKIGTAVIFPSFLAHRVTKVSKGSRKSIVCQACGPRFK